jgi:hypothetical protein
MHYIQRHRSVIAAASRSARHGTRRQLQQKSYETVTRALS